MGFQDFMDAVLGRSRLPKAKSDKLFAISTASITLENNLGLKPSGYTGICFKPIVQPTNPPRKRSRSF